MKSRITRWALGMLFCGLFFCQAAAMAEIFTSTKTFDSSQGISWNYSWVQEVAGLPSNADVQSARIELSAQVWYWGMYPSRLDMLCSDSTTFSANDSDYQVCQLTPSTHPSSSRFYTITCDLTPKQIGWLTDDNKLNLMMATSFNGTFYLDYAEITVETADAKVMKPVLSPAPGIFFSDQKIAMSCPTDGAWIAYTLDGSDPTEASTRYTGPISITERTIVRAKAFKSGLDPSEVAGGIYAVRKGGDIRLFLRDGGLLSPEMGDPVPWVTRYVYPNGDDAVAVWKTDLMGDLAGVYAYQMDVVESAAAATLKIEFIVETADGPKLATVQTIDVGAIPTGEFLPLGENLIGPDLETADGDQLTVQISLAAGAEPVGIGMDGAAEYNDSSVTVYYDGPTTCFSLSPADPGNDRVYRFDASCSADEADPGTSLEFRWDWENDDEYDTPFSGDAAAEHEFPIRGIKTVKLQVRNPAGEKMATTETASIPLPFTDAFTLPGKAPLGLAWDGYYLWHSDGASRTIYQSTLSGDVVRSFPSPCANPLDLAWDGHDLWIIDAWGDDDKGNILYQVDVEGEVLKTLQLPADISTGLTWDGRFLWGADGTNQRIVKIDPDTGDIVLSFASPGTGPRGLAWDGRHLWNADFDEGRIYELDPSGRVLNAFDSPGGVPTGLTWDGGNLWCMDLDSYTAYFTSLGRIQVYPTGLNLSEPDGAAAATVRLEQRPTAPVILTLESTNPAEIETPGRVVLDESNWRTGADITVAVRDDPYADGERRCTLLIDAAVSEDSYFHGYNPPDIGVVVADDDVLPLAIVSVSPAVGSVDRDLPVTIVGSGFSQDMAAFVVRQDEDGNPIDEVGIASMDVVGGSEARLVIPARTEAGQYGLKLTRKETEYTLQSAVSFLEDAAVDAMRRKKAIIVAGGGPYPGNVLWNATRLCAVTAYGALVSQGYTNDTIQFLSPESEIDGDGDGAADVDGAATLMMLQTAVETWARTPTAPDAPVEEVLIYLTGHGGDGVFELNDAESLEAATLDAWLDDLQTLLTGRIIVVYDACMSGSFVPALTPPAGFEEKRIVLSGASAGERAWFVNDGVISFSYRFWSSVRDKGRLFGSYLDGREMVSIDQTARIDLDGDGASDEVTPDLLTEDLIIGRGRVAASTPPRIDTVSADGAVLTCGTSSTLAARDISAQNGVESVWARVIVPDRGGLPSDPLLTLPTVKLTDSDSDGVYECRYDAFTENGLYSVAVYAVDKSGYYSIPRPLTVTRNCEGIGPRGDLNDDGTVDLADAVIGLRVLAGVDVSHLLRADFVASNADCNLDMQVGLAEIIFALGKAADQ